MNANCFSSFIDIIFSTCEQISPVWDLLWCLQLHTVRPTRQTHDRCSVVLQTDTDRVMPSLFSAPKWGCVHARKHEPLVKNEHTTKCAHKSLLMWAWLHTCGYELGWFYLLSLRESACNYTVKVPMGAAVLALRHIPLFLLYCGFDRKTDVCVCVLTVSAHVQQHNH